MTNEKRNSLNQDGQEMTQPMTRSSRQQRRQRTVRVEESTPQKRGWVQIRLLPIWLRVVLVLLLLMGTAILGTMIGYGFIGDGNPGDIFKKGTWVHILDIINGKES